MKEFLRLLPFIFVSVFLAGCNVIAPESRIEDVSSLSPKRWVASEASQAGIDTQWVDRFKDKELSKLVGIAISSAPDIRASRERVEQARQDARLAVASLKPTISFDGNAERSQSNFPGFFNGSSVFSSFTPGIRVSWEPDIWGDQRAAASAVIGEFQAQSAEYRASKALLVAEVCRAWFSLAEAREQEVLAKNGIKLLKDTVYD